jgi:trehalose 6-phosphate phosphatase
MDADFSARLSAFAETQSVAVVSGRALEDLQSRLTFKPTHLIGNHGLESDTTTPEALEEAESLSRQWRDQILARGQSLFQKHHYDLEEKSYSLSVHFRNSPDPELAGRELLPLLQSLHPEARIIPGHYVMNVVPPRRNKGVALVELMRHYRYAHAVYVGDDVTDEDVFDLESVEILSVRIGYSETSHAEFFLHKQGELRDLLEFISRPEFQNHVTSA